MPVSESFSGISCGTSTLGLRGQVLGGGGGLFYAWWMFWASEGAKAMLEETSAPVVGVLLSAASWVKDAVQALVARITGAALLHPRREH